MRAVHHHGGWVILLSFVAALMLTLIPLPDWAAYLRPEWVTIVLIYWCMALPQRVGVGIGWLAGLFLDVVHGAVLGQYAMALALIAYFTLNLHQRLRVYPMAQQALVVLLLILFQQLLVIWVKGFIGESPESLRYWLPAVTTMLLWPWLFVLLRDLRRNYRVR
jgi:rod shape-determining protein MreD